MKVYLGAASAALFACAMGPAHAVEVTGADITLGYSAFTEDNDFNASALEGSLEVGFNKQFGVQLDLGYHKFGAIDDDATTATLHGIYHVDDATSLGLFYGRDSALGGNIDFYGIEAGHEYDRFDVEGYVAHGEESGFSGTVVGLSGAYAATDSFKLGLSLDNADFDGGVTVRRVGVKGAYDFGTAASVYAEIGSLNGKVGGFSDSETFVGVGASFSFGADRGATFGQRGLAHLIPGL